MSITAERKQDLIAEYSTQENDTGSPEVQVAILSERITNLTEHLKSNKKEKLGVLIPGMGAVASTFICGVIACNKGLAKPIGSMSQMGSIRLGKRTEDRSPIIKDFAPLADLDNLAFGGWDIADENVYEISIRSEVLDINLLNDPVSYTHLTLPTNREV